MAVVLLGNAVKPALVIAKQCLGQVIIRLFIKYFKLLFITYFVHSLIHKATMC